MTEIKNLLTSCGFTPILDPIVKKYGYMTAIVFGAVHRFAMMEDGICRASYETMADMIGCSKGAISKHIGILVSDGLLKQHGKAMEGSPAKFSISVHVVNGLHTELCEARSLSEQNRSRGERIRSRGEPKKEERKNYNDDSGEKTSPTLTALVANYQDVISLTLSQTMADELADYAGRVKVEWVVNAFKVAEAQNVRKWAYVRAILDSCIAAGRWVDKRGNQSSQTTINGRVMTW